MSECTRVSASVRVKLGVCGNVYVCMHVCNELVSLSAQMNRSYSRSNTGYIPLNPLKMTCVRVAWHTTILI